MYDKRNDTYVACDTGGGPFARQWVTAKAGLVQLGDYLEGHRRAASRWCCRRRPEPARDGARVEDPAVVERHRARPRPLLPPGLLGAGRPLLPREGARRGARGAHQELARLQGADEAVSVGFHEAARGVLSHHMVIRDGKVANYQPYPPTPWNANPRDIYGTPGPYEDAVQNTPIFEENGPENFKGIDIMRAVRSFDPCLPCGVHMYTGGGRVKKVQHTPTGCADAMTTERADTRRAGPSASQDAHRSSRGDRSTRWPARPPRSSSGPCIDLYGEGLVRIARGPRRGRAAGAPMRGGSSRTGWWRSLLLIHGLHPVPLEERVQEALDERAPLPRVARRRRRAARARGRRRAPAPGGQLQRLPPRRPRSSWRSRRRSRRRARPLGSRSRAVAGRRRRGGRCADLARRRRRRGRPGSRSARRAGSSRRRRRPVVATSRHLLAYRDACAGCGGRCSAARCTTARWPARRAAASPARPAAGRRRATCPQPVPLLEGDAKAAAAHEHSCAISAGRSRRAEPGASRALRPLRPDRAGHRHLLQLGSGDPLHCELFALRSGDAEFRPSGRDDWLELDCPTTSGPASRSRSASPSHAQQPRPTGSSRSTRARPARPSASSTWRRGTSWWPLNPVLGELEPDAEGADRQPHWPTRTQYAIAPIDRCYALVGRSSRAGRASRAARRWRRRSPASSTDLRAGGDAMSRPTPTLAVAIGAELRCRTRPAPTLRFSLDVRRRHRARGLHRRADRPGPHRAGQAALRRRRRASAWSTCSARPSAGRPDPRRSSGAGSTRSCRASPGTGSSTLPVPVHLRPRAGRHASTWPRCRTARCRSPSTSTARSSTAARTTGCRSTQIPWSCSARFGCRVAVWRELIDHHYPRSGWIRLHADTLDDLRRRRAERGAADLRRVRRRPARRAGAGP